MTNEDRRWISTSGAAGELGITLRSLYGLLDDGELVAYRFGRVIRIDRAELASFIERRGDTGEDEDPGGGLPAV